MTKAELNRQIKKLSNDWKKLQSSPADNYFSQKDELGKELKRLYHVDPNMEYMNASSLRIMIRLNLSFRVIPFHHFGIQIEL